jgi:formylglycine-generating enzyme required for sulfatase activity
LGIISLILAITFVAGQVIIVPNKLQTARENNKTKAKTKPKANIPPAATPSPLPDPASPVDARPLAFAVFPPLSLKDVAPASRLASNITPVRLSEYSFDVITSDARGKVTETRKERARYFIEELNGGWAIEMVEIPGGMFLMGTTAGEIKQIGQEQVRGIEKEEKERLQQRLQWETPQRAVKVSAFYLSKYEITQALWRAVAGLPKVKRELTSDPSYFKGGARPVEMVSWEDAVEFCGRLSRATGRKYRLPTEAEWEYACRGGARSPFHFGAAIMPAWANYHGKYPYADAPKGVNRQQTTPVGSLGMANAFGLYDMHGNVWEWCLDSWRDNYFSASSDGKSWEGGGISNLKVIRGGGWDSHAVECRVSSRNRISSSFRLSGIGFRVVVETPIKAGG